MQLFVILSEGFTASGLSGTTEADPMTALENAFNDCYYRVLYFSWKWSSKHI